MRRAFGSICVLALIALGAAAEQPPNFGVVIDDQVYRGGQPRDGQFDYLHDLGVRTILKLNSHGLDDEQAAAKRLGLKLVHIPFDPSTIGTAETCGEVARALALLSDRANWPIYVHCSRGRDRAGYLVGAFRELVLGWPWDEVDNELARYGHTEGMRRAFPQVTKELRAGAPTCSSEVLRAVEVP